VVSLPLEVLQCPYRWDASGDEACCTRERAVGKVVRTRDCLSCVGKEHDTITVREAETKVYRDESTPLSPVIHRRVGDGRFVPAGVDGQYSGAKAFLVCGGPSLADHDLSLMYGTGALVFAVNNAGAYPGVRPHFWTCVDRPESFHQNIWLDPSICKLVRMTHSAKELRRKEGGVFSPLGRQVHACPNVLYYDKSDHFSAPRFLSEEVVSWGCGDGTQCSEGFSGGRSVMLAAIKLLAVLGVKEIYAVGADLRMEQEKPYAFDQRKDPTFDAEGKKLSDPIRSNNRGYGILDARIKALKPYLSRAGITIYDVRKEFDSDTPRGLASCEPLRYSVALSRASVGLDPCPDLSGWYGGK
jgi:hypothetical protein